MYRLVWKITLQDPSKKESFIENWKNISKIIQEFDGALGTRLYTLADEANTYFSIAEWESKAKRDVMEKEFDEGISECAQRRKKFMSNEDFGEVVILARGDEIEHILPSSKN